jgi:imidazole glycerol-phosphate synthase subunit HisH
MRCVIVDYGMGNLRSIQHKLKSIEIESWITSDVLEIEKADVIIFPGVGHFARGMQNLNGYGLIPVLTRKVIEEKTPIMGICLGMQLFTQRSEEGNVEGLGWIDAITRKFNFDGAQEMLRLPHIAWNTLSPARESPLLDHLRPDQRFYFIHSYHVCCNNPNDVLTTTRYGYEFVSSVRHANIFGVQFHPEKSHLDGMQLIRNFMHQCSVSS